MKFVFASVHFVLRIRSRALLFSLFVVVVVVFNRHAGLAAYKPPVLITASLASATIMATTINAKDFKAISA